MERLLTFGLFVFGFMLGTWSFRKVWGTFLKFSVVGVVASVGVMSCTPEVLAAGPPAGMPDELKVNYSGLNFEKLSTTFAVPGFLNPYSAVEALKSGQWVVKWNGTDWSLVKSFSPVQNLYVNVTNVGGLRPWVVSYSYVEIVGGWKVHNAKWDSTQPTGTYSVAFPLSNYYAQQSEAEHHASDAAIGGSVDLVREIWGTVTVVTGDDPVGQAYASDNVPLRWIVTKEDTLWRGRDGQVVFPLSKLADKASYSPLVASVDPAAGSPAGTPGTAGWSISASAWAQNNCLGINAAVTLGAGAPTLIAPLPPRWEISPMILPSFGGYAVGALDVCDATYVEEPQDYHYWTVAGGTATKNTTTYSPHAVRRVGTNVERWIVVCATEPDTRRPYVEVRKTSGERVRFYPAGNAVRWGTAWRFQEDGFTQAPQLSPRSIENGSPTLSIQPINYPFYFAGPYLAFAGSVSTGQQDIRWPAEGLPIEIPTTLPSTRPHDAAVDWLVGTPVSGGSVSADDFFAKAKQDAAYVTAATRPSWMLNPDTYNPSSNAVGAWNDCKAFFSAMGQPGLMEAPIGLPSGSAGSSSMTFVDMNDIGLMLFGAVQETLSFGGDVLAIARVFVSIGMVWGTGMYAYRQLWWAVGARDSERAEPPIEPGD